MADASLRDVVQPEQRGNLAGFARATGVSWTTAWRWTLPPDHPDHCIPLRKHWRAIEQATGGRWTAPHASFSGRPTKRRDKAIDSAASRKGWATRRRQEQARP